MIDVVVALGTRLGTAAAIVGCGYVLAIVARRLLQRLLNRPGISQALGPSMERMVPAAVQYLLLGIACALALIALGVPTVYVTTITIILVAVIAIAIQQSVTNLAATVVFLLFQPFRRGELVETMGYLGTVREILLFNSVLLLPDERLVSLPNSKIQESGVVNYSRMGRLRASFGLTVAYGERVERVRDLILEIAASDPRILDRPPCDVVVDELGASGVRILVLPTVRPGQYWAVRGELQERIADRFTAEGIRFAVTHWDVRVDSRAVE